MKFALGVVGAENFKILKEESGNVFDVKVSV